MKQEEVSLAGRALDADVSSSEKSSVELCETPSLEFADSDCVELGADDTADQVLEADEGPFGPAEASLVIEEEPQGCKYCGEIKPPSAMQGRTCKNCAYHRRQRRRALLLLVCGQCGKEKPGTAFRPDKPVCRACENGDISKDGLTNFCPNCNEDLTSYLEFHAQNRNEATEELLQEYEQENQLIIRALERRLVALGGELCTD